MCLRRQQKKMQSKPKYFDLEEFLLSQTAVDNDIQNLPTFEIVEHLLELALFLDPLREEWGSAINITSGFRNKELNEAVGGVDNSCHRLGYAADMVPANGDMKGFKKCVIEWLKDQVFDEAIMEKNSKGDTWCHLQLYSPKGFQRKKVFSMEVN